MNDLLNYYKHVKICSICRKEYGIDRPKRDNGICPICMKKLLRETLSEKDNSLQSDKKDI
jgi:rRNA maturation endonuclease Nob1